MSPIQLREQFAEYYTDGRIRYSQLAGLNLAQAIEVHRLGRAAAGIDDPDLLDTECQVAVYTLLKAAQAVFWRTNFDRNE